MTKITFRYLASVLVCILLLTINCEAQFTNGQTIHGPNLSNFGTVVRGAGDLNNDGYDDIIAGAPGFLGHFGAAIAYSGADGSILYNLTGQNSTEQLGWSVDGIGDITGNGYDDFIVGGPGINSGLVQVFSGFNGNVLHSYVGSEAGKSVSAAGDVNGDGVPDFAYGAPGESASGGGGPNSRGKVYVISGIDGSTLFTFSGEGTFNYIGDVVSGAGDVNNDGHADIMMSGAVIDNGATIVRVLSGADGSTLYTKSAANPGDSFGRAISDVGDVNGDDFDDFIIGSFIFNSNGPSMGQTKLFSGADGSVIYEINGNNLGDRLGFSVSGAGDVNGDGSADFVIGAPGSSNTPGEGFVRIYSGCDGSILDTSFAAPSTLFYGYDVNGAGDVDSDGFDDVVIGQPYYVGAFAGLGRFQVRLAPTLPTRSYDASVPSETQLRLEWLPDLGNVTSLTGTVRVSNATPGGLGIFGVSLADLEFPLPFGFPLLIANDPLNLLDSGNFGFDFGGELNYPNVSRQHPYISGISIYVQAFEFSPTIAASNGLRLDMEP